MENKKQIEILKAAETEFLSRGFEGARMDNIAHLAGVSKRTMYKYYSSKQIVYDALLSWIFAKIRVKLNYPFDAALPFEEQFAQVLEIKINLCKSDYLIKVAKLMALNQIKQGDCSSSFVKQFSQNQQQFETWAQLCQDCGFLTTDFSAEEISCYFHSLIDGFFMWPLILGQKKHLTERDYIRGKELIKVGFIHTFGES